MSREIDARVAREVMGHDVHHSGETPAFCEGRDFSFYYISVGPEGEKKIYALPEYSTDMNAAMEVLSKIIGRHDSAKILVLPGSDSDPRPWFEVVIKIGLRVFPAVVSRNSLAEAICLAALEAVKSTG